MIRTMKDTETRDIEANKRPRIFDRADGQELRINMINSWMKRHYEEMGLDEPTKIVKLSIDGGFTCPNRDGTKGVGGCLFCSESGSGDMASSAEVSVSQALENQMELLENKWPKEKYNRKYIAYFQNHTNTYGSADKLRRLFESAIEQPDVIGLAVATRSDCISDEALEVLKDINPKTFLWVELGLQTVHDETADKMNLCHDLEDYNSAFNRLYDAGIRVVTHLILGLPGESREDMLESVRYVCEPKDKDGRAKLFGLKLHMLNVVRGSAMETQCSDYVPFDSPEEYVDLLIEALEIIPSEITLHRISGDAPRATLISPEWSYKKRTILNMIHNTMRSRNTWQGIAVNEPE